MTTDCGTNRGYTNGCKCDDCRRAHADVQKYQRHQARERFANGEVEIVHGITTGYGHWGCKCDPCLEAWRASQARSRAKKTPSTS